MQLNRFKFCFRLQFSVKVSSLAEYSFQDLRSGDLRSSLEGSSWNLGTPWKQCYTVQSEARQMKNSLTHKTSYWHRVIETAKMVKALWVDLPQRSRWASLTAPLSSSLTIDKRNATKAPSRNIVG